MKNGLLLINLGTPDSPDRSAVRRYLLEFLSDKRVIDLPAVVRYPLVFLILLSRPKQTAHAYQSIWTERGSPLLYHNEDLCKKVQEQLGEHYQVALGMRYGKPSIQSALESLKECKQITVLPLYPQYSSAATGSSLEKFFQLIKTQQIIPSVFSIRDFYNHPEFIQAQAERVSPYLATHDHVLFSYHGLPERQLIKSGCSPHCEKTCTSISTKNQGCYRAQCHETSRALGKYLKLDESQYSLAFQSRLGRTPWIKPYTDEILTDLLAKGIKRLIVACPSFTTDCLETLEEIGIRLKAQWLEMGGEVLTLTPCLNAEDDWAQAVINIAYPEKTAALAKQ